MPELPEVETVKNSLKELIIGKKITSVKVFYERMIQNINVNEFESKIINQTFIGIERVGKYLIFILDNYILLAHLRMEGKYFLKKDEPKNKHEHVIFYLENGETLRYNDTRKFGVIYLFETTNIEEIRKKEPLSKLGIEPLENLLTEDYLYNKLSKINKPLKTVLLDQTIISGLGNIYADEVCFMSALSPKEKACNLTKEDIKRICISAEIVIKKAINLGGTTIRSFVSSHAATGRFQNELLIHTKDTCPNCNQKVEKIFIGGRGTYFCPKCQKVRNTMIGITGGIGTGKSTVCNYIKEKGYKVFDCDKISHDLLEYNEDVKNKIIKEFGTEVLVQDNQNIKIDRKSLGKIVFNDYVKKQKLESIIHPEVIKEIKRLKKKHNICFIEVPLLYEAKLERLFDNVIVVYSPVDVQIERIMKRNNYTKEEALSRINAQMSIEEKKQKTNYVINTNCDMNKTYHDIDRILNSLL